MFQFNTEEPIKRNRLDLLHLLLHLEGNQIEGSINLKSRYCTLDRHFQIS